MSAHHKPRCGVALFNTRSSTCLPVLLHHLVSSNASYLPVPAVVAVLWNMLCGRREVKLSQHYPPADNRSFLTILGSESQVMCPGRRAARSMVRVLSLWFACCPVSLRFTVTWTWWVLGGWDNAARIAGDPWFLSDNALYGCCLI
ncbi:hypothetical protein Tco_0153598 [Tanacetum coccineum]